MNIAKSYIDLHNDLPELDMSHPVAQRILEDMARPKTVAEYIEGASVRGYVNERDYKVEVLKGTYLASVENTIDTRTRNMPVLKRAAKLAPRNEPNPSEIALAIIATDKVQQAMHSVASACMRDDLDNVQIQGYVNSPDNYLLRVTSFVPYEQECGVRHKEAGFIYEVTLTSGDSTDPLDFCDLDHPATNSAVDHTGIAIAPPARYPDFFKMEIEEEEIVGVWMRNKEGLELGLGTVPRTDDPAEFERSARVLFDSQRHHYRDF